jgi:hypothetical protein
MSADAARAHDAGRHEESAELVYMYAVIVCNRILIQWYYRLTATRSLVETMIIAFDARTERLDDLADMADFGEFVF